MKNGEIYCDKNKNNYMLIEYPLYTRWKLIPGDNNLRKGTKWGHKEEIREFIETEDLECIYTYNDPVPEASNPNNFNLSGDEARLFLTLLLSQQHKFSGNLLPLLFNLVQRLEAISMVQPPIELKGAQ